MGSCLFCCTTCNCPRPVDTAIGRRQILNESRQLLEKYTYKSPLVKVTEAYVEKADGTLLYTKLFEPKDPKNAVAMICYCLGLSANANWLSQDIGVKYAELGFIVFMADWKGHGKSDGQFIHIDDFDEDIVDEGLWIFTYAINKYIKANAIYSQQIDRNNNYFLSGASMGGAIALKMAFKSADNDDEKYSFPGAETPLLRQTIFRKWKGVVLVCPMVAIKESAMPPEWQIWCLSNCCLPCCPNYKVIPNKVSGSLTRDVELERIINANPMRYLQSFSLVTGYNMVKATQNIEENAKKFKMPMLICHGDDDQVTDCKMSQLFYENCGCPANDKSIKIYQGKGHFLYAESPNVYKDTVQWMTQRINM